MDVKGNPILLTMPAFGVTKVKAVVTAIKPTHLNTENINWATQTTAPVIGIFKRYVTDVRTYTFRDHLGRLSQISATPNHPFYLKNKNVFIPVDQITVHDLLLGTSEKGEDVLHLACLRGKDHDCGIPNHDLKLPTVVYNLEIYNKHTYQVGNVGIVVHNVCAAIPSSNKTYDIYRKLKLGEMIRFRVKDHDYLFGLNHDGIFFKTDISPPGGVEVQMLDKETIASISSLKAWHIVDEHILSSSRAEFIGRKVMNARKFDKIFLGQGAKGWPTKIIRYHLQHDPELKLISTPTVLNKEGATYPMTNCRMYCGQFVPSLTDPFSLVFSRFSK